MSNEINNIENNLHKHLNTSPSSAHDDLRKLLYWEGRSFETWTSDDMKLGGLIQKIFYKPYEPITDEDKEVVRRVLTDRLKKSDTTDDLSHLI